MRGAGGAAPALAVLRVRAGARRAQAACAVRAGPLLAPAAPSLARRASRRALAGSPAGSLARGGRAGGGGAACSSQGSPQPLGSPQRPGPAARRPPPPRRRRHVALPAAPQHLALRAERGRRHPVRGGGRGAARAAAGGLGRGAGCEGRGGGGEGTGPAAPARRAPCSAPANKAGSEPPAGGGGGRAGGPGWPRGRRRPRGRGRRSPPAPCPGSRLNERSGSGRGLVTNRDSQRARTAGFGAGMFPVSCWASLFAPAVYRLPSAFVTARGASPERRGPERPHELELLRRGLRGRGAYHESSSS